jgi:hypothetical protein
MAVPHFFRKGLGVDPGAVLSEGAAVCVSFHGIRSVRMRVDRSFWLLVCGSGGFAEGCVGGVGDVTLNGASPLAAWASQT